MTASGTAGHGAELGAYGRPRRLGAVVVKSLSAEPWPGNAAPRVHEAAAGMLNSVGLQGPGVAAWLERASCPASSRPAPGWWSASGVAGSRTSPRPRPALAGVTAGGGGRRGQRQLPERRGPVADVRPLADGHGRGGRRGGARAGLPRWAKLSPNVADSGEIAGAALEAGPEALTLVNTLLGLAVDLEATAGRSLGAGGGGLSGPALHPVAVRAVCECRAAFPDAAHRRRRRGRRGRGRGRAAAGRGRRGAGGHGHLPRPAGAVAGPRRAGAVVPAARGRPPSAS